MLFLKALFKSLFADNLLASILLGSMLVLIIYIALPNLDRIKEIFGIDTVASLKVDKEKQKQAIDTAVTVNKNLVATIEVIEKTHENINKVEEAKKVAIKKVETDTAIKLSNKKADIDKAVTEDGKADSIKVSTIQINSIWQTYCEYNTDSLCGS